MWRMLLIALLLAGCVTQPPHPDEAEAKQFRPVAGKAVIYVYREYQDFGRQATPVHFDDLFSGTTYPGTFFRWVVEPGEHRIDGFGPDTGSIRLNVEAGKIYYVRHSTWAMFSFTSSVFQLVNERAGRDGVARASLMAPL